MWDITHIFSSYTWFSWQCFICSQKNSKNSFKCYFHYLKPIENLKLNPVKSPERFVFQTLLYSITYIVQVICSFSSLTIAYTNLLFNSYSLTFLVTMSDNCIPPSHHTVLCKIHSLQFLTKWILLEICIVCFVYLPLLSTYTDYLISNITRSDCYGTTSGYLFIRSFLE